MHTTYILHLKERQKSGNISFAWPYFYSYSLPICLLTVIPNGKQVAFVFNGQTSQTTNKHITQLCRALGQHNIPILQVEGVYKAGMLGVDLRKLALDYIDDCIDKLETEKQTATFRTQKRLVNAIDQLHNKRVKIQELFAPSTGEGRDTERWSGNL